MNKHEPITMYRKLLGYRSGNRKRPVFAPMPGALVTQAFIFCSQCRTDISPNMGPHRDTWCISCTEKEEKEAPKREAKKQEQEKEDKRRQEAIERAEELRRLKDEQ